MTGDWWLMPFGKCSTENGKRGGGVAYLFNPNRDFLSSSCRFRRKSPSGLRCAQLFNCSTVQQQNPLLDTSRLRRDTRSDIAGLKKMAPWKSEGTCRLNGAAAVHAAANDFPSEASGINSLAQWKPGRSMLFLWRAFLGSFFSKKNERKIRRILLGLWAYLVPELLTGTLEVTKAIEPIAEISHMHSKWQPPNSQIRKKANG